MEGHREGLAALREAQSREVTCLLDEQGLTRCS